MAEQLLSYLAHMIPLQADQVGELSYSDIASLKLNLGNKWNEPFECFRYKTLYTKILDKPFTFILIDNGWCWFCACP
jgi:hypothetical protein